MIVYSGNELNKFVERSLNCEFKERFLIEKLHNFMTTVIAPEVVCLYGLKHTGKTTMALQEMRKLDDFENSIWIICENGDKMKEIYDIFDNDKNIKYAVIEDITNVSDFVEYSAFLANVYACMGMKIVLISDNNFSLDLASCGQLFDRVRFLHTTYIPFKEFNFLLNRGIEDYIEFGGVMNDDFCNSDTVSEYINSAIAGNICSVFNDPERNTHFASVHLCEAALQGKLRGLVREFIERRNGAFFYREIKKKTAEDVIENEIFEYLKTIDALYAISGQYRLEKGIHDSDDIIFMQPGLRYFLAKSFCENDAEIKEKMLHEIIFYQLSHEFIYDSYHKGDLKVMQYFEGDKFFIAILGHKINSVCVIEARFSSAQKSEFTAQIRDNIGERSGTPVENNAVVYLGKSGEFDGILFINAEEFLCNSKNIVLKMFGLNSDLK